MIQFKEVLSTKVPGQYTEFDNTRASSSSKIPWKALIIGHASRNSGITPELVTSAEYAIDRYGYGSQVALMVEKFKKNCSNVPVYVLPLKEKSSATAAKFKLTATITGTAKAGTLHLYVDGFYIPVSIGDSATASDVVDAIAAAVGTTAAASSVTKWPVVASAGTASGGSYYTELSVKNAGTSGNYVDVRFNYNEGEHFPEGVSVAITKTAGTLETDLSDLEEAESPATPIGLNGQISSMWFNAVVCGVCGNSFNDPNLIYLKEEFERRWTATVQKLGVVFTGYCNDSVGTSISGFYNKLNTPVLSIPNSHKFPTSPAEFAAAYAGVCAQSGSLNPVSPIGNIELKGILAPGKNDDLNFEEKGLLLDAGCPDIDCDENTRTVYVRRSVTTYTQDSMGNADDSYSQVETIFCLNDFRYGWNAKISKKYSQAGCAPDSEEFPAGVVVVTPSTLKAEAVEYFEEKQRAGMLYNKQAFVESLVCEIDETDKRRINIVMMPDFVKQLFVTASKVMFG